MGVTVTVLTCPVTVCRDVIGVGVHVEEEADVVVCKVVLTEVVDD